MDLERPKLIINGVDHSRLLIGALLLLGVVMVLFPRSTWWWRESWLPRDSEEPSGLWLFWTRVCGVLVVLSMAYMLTHDGKLTIPLPH